MVQLPLRVLLSALAVSALAVALAPASPATAATYIDGPVDLGTAAPYSVLAGSTVTNTGPSVLNGDVGLSPGTSITGFPPGVVNGVVHATDTVAAQSQIDLTEAYGVAAGLTPIATGLGDLTGSSLTPGVYAGGELSLTGALTLEGTAQSVWVFQAASTLTVGSGAIITMTGGASACNVFWQVSSSATLDTGAQFVGTVLADETITAATGAVVTGRLLARTGAVTLDTNTITAPTGCAVGTVTTSPDVTSTAPPEGEVDAPYSHVLTASGSPGTTYTVTSGGLPTGIVLDSATGRLSGIPTAAGTFSFGITASNGIGPDDVVDYSITILAASGLAASGYDSGPVPLVAAILIAAGVSLVAASRARRLEASTVRTSARGTAASL